MTATLVWTDICAYNDLMPERGVCALIGGDQVAIFRTREGGLFALSNLDPYSDANVLSRGILGCRGGVPTVASPMYKNAFALTTGQSLDDPEHSVRTYPVRQADGRVQVAT